MLQGTNYAPFIESFPKETRLKSILTISFYSPALNILHHFCSNNSLHVMHICSHCICMNKIHNFTISNSYVCIYRTKTIPLVILQSVHLQPNLNTIDYCKQTSGHKCVGVFNLAVQIDFLSLPILVIEFPLRMEKLLF